MKLILEIFAGACALMVASVAFDIIVACITMKDQRAAIEDYIQACREADRLA